jgi:hypothetical protein
MVEAYELLNYRRLPRLDNRLPPQLVPPSFRMHLIFQLDLLQFGWINAYSQVLD